MAIKKHSDYPFKRTTHDSSKPLNTGKLAPKNKKDHRLVDPRVTPEMPKKPVQVSMVVLAKYTVLLGSVFSFIFLVAFWVMIGNREIHVLENFRDQDLIVTLKWLQERDLKPIVYEKLAADVDRNRIISQNPEPGMFVKEGRAVTLIVSAGTQLEIMGNFIGSEFGLVKKQIYTQLAGARRIPRVVKIERFSETAPEGIIIDQLPRPDEQIDVEQDIVFFVSRGLVENSFRVEDFRMEAYRKVYDNLTSKGIDVQVKFLPTTDPAKAGLIFDQDISPGTIVAEGTTVKFTVAIEGNDTNLDAAALPLEKLRVFTMRVPFPVTSLAEVTASDQNVANNNNQYYCPCLGTSAIYEDRTALSNISENDDKAAAREIVLRDIEFVISDAVQEDYRVVYRSILAGRLASFPYRTVGTGKIDVYIDGKFYKSEQFADE
ncbi:hypothetical protein COTS27_00463 [Spirochaetota bacterium]|nr:hypothetical protein COTS27_00463 [Spirochaetota bacterium]